MRPIHWLNFIVGVWLVASSFMDLTVQAMQNNLMISGLVVAVLALTGAVSHSSASHPHMTR